MAIIRLASPCEDEKRFGALLASATKMERSGIFHTRNVVCHAGCVAVNDAVFWTMVTVQLPQFLEKIRRENGL